MSAQVIEQVKQIISRMERLREASLKAKFSAEQIACIESWQSDESFKVKALRTAGYGTCASCDKPTGYVEKLRFYEFCSTVCETTKRRKHKLEKTKHEFLSFGLNTDAVDYEDIESIANFWCGTGHSFKDSIRNIRYNHKGCKICKHEKIDADRHSRKQARIALDENKKAEKLQAEKQHKKDALQNKLTGLSHVKCKACAKHTPFKLYGSRFRAKMFCDDVCKNSYQQDRFHAQFLKLKNLLDTNKFEHAGFLDSNRQDTQHLIKFKECGHVHPVILRNIARPLPGTYENGFCPQCNRWSSLTAKKLIDALIESGLSIKENDRKILNGKEIDILVDGTNIGIEVNGVWWHSSFYKDNNYHLEKTRAAREAGINLLHIFSDEIDQQLPIVKSLILQKLGKSQKIHARKCTVGYITPSESAEFLKTTHLQGRCNASYHIGLKHDSKLVSVMSFRKPFIKSTASWEIARFSTELGLTIVGGASKMLAFFEQHHEGTIMTFSDERYTTGSVYEKLGFTHVRTTKPGFSYVINGQRQNRLKFQKHLLEQRGINTEGKTEQEALAEINIPRIYDCGNKVWIKHR